MSNDNEDFTMTPEAELAALKARADMLGIRFHPSISLEKLREKVTAAIVAEPDAPVKSVKEARDDLRITGAAFAAEPVEETITQRRFRKKREANALVRVRVTCMNPAKKDWEGEIFTSGNSLVGSFTKFVPFNADEGWHVPHILLEQIKERQCQIFVPVKDARGNTTRKGKLIKEFAIEVMDALTPAELQDLAQRQAMAKSID